MQLVLFQSKNQISPNLILSNSTSRNPNAAHPIGAGHRVARIAGICAQKS